MSKHKKNKQQPQRSVDNMQTNNNLNTENVVDNAPQEIIIEPEEITEISAEVEPEPENAWQQETEALQKQFLESYVEHCEGEEKMPVDEWLPLELQNALPERTEAEIQDMSKELIESLQTTEDKKADLQKAHSQGRSTESWLEKDLKNSLAYLSEQETVQYMQNLDNTLQAANRAMQDVVTTKSGLINMNPSLDGYIAEQAHVNTFNMNAASSGSTYRAEVPPLKPGETYGKNSVDIFVKDNAGNIVQKYQAKYGATAEDTIRMIKTGDYRGQRLLVPADQVEAVQEAFPNRTVVATISADGVNSNEFTKSEVKGMQKDAQSGYSLDADWSLYSTKDITKSICSNVAKAGLMGMAVGAGTEVISKVLNDEEVDGDEVVAAAITTGADFGVKTAAAGALKAASEKGILTILPKGTPAAAFANIAFVAVENVKIATKWVNGELDSREAIDEMQTTTASCIAGIAASGKGFADGAIVGGVVFGPVGAVVGGVVGGAVGYMAGSTVGRAVTKCYQKVRDTVFKPVADAVSNAVDTVRDVASDVFSGIGNFLSGIFW